MQKKQAIWGVALFLLGAASAFVYLARPGADPLYEQRQSDANVSRPRAGRADEEPRADLFVEPGLQSEAGADSPLSATSKPTYEQWQQIKDWRYQKGYGDAHRDYSPLSDDELESLGAQGDVRALQILSQRYNVHEPLKTLAYLDKAAVFGSTYALVQSGITYEFHTRRGKTLVDPADPESGFTKALGYYLAAQRLGDDLSAREATDILLKKVDFSQEMIADACLQAKGHDARLKSQRLAIGLGDFERDNSPPISGLPDGGALSEVCGI